MPRMLDLIRESQVPANLMHAAARGSLSVAPAEMIEILVYLAVHHKGLGQEAQLTLAGWDEKACLAAASNPATSQEVLGYFSAVENQRTNLLPVLAENPSVTEEALGELASRGSRSTVEGLLKSHRIMNSAILLKSLQSNANLRQNELAEVGNKLASLEPPTTSAAGEESGPHDPAIEDALNNFFKENAAEVEADKHKPFQPIGPLHDHIGHDHIEAEAPVPATAATNAAADVGMRVATGTAAAAAAARSKKQAGHVERRDSTLQKIAKLDIKGRIALAVRGSKEERSILIRDGTKLVALAVLESPKVTDGEVEGFALQKNVLEAVLRQIPLKRRFAKNYNIMRNLVYNPRTPLDLSLGLMKGLLVHDLKNLSGNKEVSETIRKLALRMFKQKMEKKN
ncbi:MAG TPA: hypothetical protein VL983_09790 [Terriglobales bacterium]|nr:hypothetical protein [Terriglobales bacterium]